MKNNGFLCVLVFLLMGCDRSKDCDCVSDSVQDQCGRSERSFDLNIKIESFKVVNKDLRSCLKVLVDSMDPVYELDKRIVLIEGIDEIEGVDEIEEGKESVDFEPAGITLDLQNIEVVPFL